ncbi:MAG: DUF4430 domain-containing protein [Bacilli bacterium]
MRKVLFPVVLTVLLVAFFGCAQPEKKPEWQFEVGTDVAEYEAPEVSEWSPVFVVNLKVIGGNNDVLFNGKVTVKSDAQLVSEALKAAMTEKGLAQEGIDMGFVTLLGDYANNAETNTYWLYSVNDVDSPSWGCNQYQMRDGDYILWEYKVVTFD